MKNYQFNYKFIKNKISYRVEVSGTIFEKETDINCYHESNQLSDSFINHLIDAVMCELSDNKDGLFLNDKSIFSYETKLIQSNANDAYAVMIDNTLYPISLNITITVDENAIDLLLK